MGRKRVKHEICEVVAAEEGVRHLSLKDKDGLYPFTSTWRWEPRAGKARGKEVSLTIDARAATPKELLAGNNDHRHFYSEFQVEYPWAVELLGRGLKSYCIDSRCSHQEASFKRNAIGYFFSFCRRTNVNLRGSEDLDYNLICEWRSDLRLLDMQSRYKGTMFRRVCSILEKIMETDLLQNKFTMPVYLSDAPEHLPPYSDAVMYQLIGACVNDISKVMAHAKESALSSQPKVGSTEDDPEAESNKTVSDYGSQSALFGNAVQRAFKAEQLQSIVYIVRCNGAETSDAHSPKSRAKRRVNLKQLSSHSEWPVEKDVPTLDSIFVFLLFFLIFSGKNKEVVESWKRIYRVGDFEVSPLDWRDPLDPTRCRLRGWKSRKGPSKIEADDTFFQISSEVFPLLEFLLHYTESLQHLANGDSKEALWLYVGRQGVSDLYNKDNFYLASSTFLKRHAIWDFKKNENGEEVKVRLLSLDSRRFRKVHAAKEFMKAISDSRNYQELQENLKHALSHKDFDTTLGSYLSVGFSRAVIDIGIFTLQSEYVAEARKFRGVRVEQVKVEGVPGFYASCVAPNEPDYEGAFQRADLNCREYDMCFGCSKSRVFDMHLPRVAARITQYESMKPLMPEKQWEYHYGKKHARATDLLQGWSDQEVVKAAWESVRRGEVKLPLIIARG